MKSLRIVGLLGCVLAWPWPAFSQQTVDYTGRLKIEALVEGFNLTNRVNVLTRNSNFGEGAYPINPSPTFMQTTSVGEARAVQVGLRARF